MNLIKTTALALVLTLNLANAMMDGDEASSSSKPVTLSSVRTSIEEIIAPVGTKAKKLVAIQGILSNLGDDFNFNREFDTNTMQMLIGAKQVENVWALLGITPVEDASKATSHTATPQESEDEEDAPQSPKEDGSALDQLEAELLTARRAAESQQRYIDELLEANDGLTRTQQEQQAFLQAAREELGVQVQRVIALEKTATTLTEERERALNMSRGLVDSFKQVQDERDLALEELETARSTLAQQQAHVAELTTSHSQLTEQQKRLEADLETARQKIITTEKTFDTKLEEHKTALTNAAKTNIKREIEKAKAETEQAVRASVQEEHQQQQKRIAELEQSATDLERARAAQQKRIAELEEEKAELDQQAKEMDEEQRESALAARTFNEQKAAILALIANYGGKKKMGTEALDQLRAILNPEA